MRLVLMILLTIVVLLGVVLVLPINLTAGTPLATMRVELAQLLAPFDQSGTAVLQAKTAQVTTQSQDSFNSSLIQARKNLNDLVINVKSSLISVISKIGQ